MLIKGIFKRFTLCVVIFGLSSGLQAEETYKIGVVNAVRVLEQSPQAQAVREMINQEFAPRDKQLVAAQKELKELEDRLQKDSAILSQTELKKLERDVLFKKRELKRNQDEFREDLNFRRNEAFAEVQKEIINAIQDIAKQHKYDVIFSESVIYASPKVDISKLVIDYLKKEFKGAKEK